ncbi:hypothetical protein [Mucilaginibacter sp. BT774]|uniref:hypothetical protein n=1 Tax=Mucilaginibacter sp. BT774 TaxID=3062276 RepID=UPI00267525D8|nr:hypothetical protein [Mucilaginibacter sp. BT774]MDO3627974.1 hypothetical protein [Mucilaginibacter sp. BT774]
MRVFYVPLFTLLFLLTAFSALAQNTTTEDPEDLLDKLEKAMSEKQASFKIGANYLSNNVFMGRADTVRTPTIIPDVKYTFKNGIYLSGTVNYIPNRVTNKLDGGSASLGYNFDITNDLGGGISFTQLFYTANSTQIGSAIGSTINANLNYDIESVITPTISVDYNFLKQGFGHDIFVNAGLSHDFTIDGIFTGRDFFIISPTVSLNAGTQNFYDAYFVLKKYKLTKKALALEQAAESLIIKRENQLSQFKMLDYEFSVPVEYKMGALILTFTPTYAMAENKLPPRITKGMVNSSGIFYFEAGVALKF